MTVCSRDQPRHHRTAVSEANLSAQALPTATISILGAKLACDEDRHPASLRRALPHHGAGARSLYSGLLNRIFPLHRQILPSLFRRADRLHHSPARSYARAHSQPAQLQSPRTPHVYHLSRSPAQSRNLCLRRTGLPGTRFAHVRNGLKMHLSLFAKRRCF